MEIEMLIVLWQKWCNGVEVLNGCNGADVCNVDGIVVEVFIAIVVYAMMLMVMDAVLMRWCLRCWLFYGRNDSMVLTRWLFYGSSLQKLMPTNFIDTITKNSNFEKYGFMLPNKIICLCWCWEKFLNLQNWQPNFSYTRWAVKWCQQNWHENFVHAWSSQMIQTERYQQPEQKRPRYQQHEQKRPRY